MRTTTVKSSVYPVDGFLVPTVLCIGVHNPTSHPVGIDVDTSINRALGCATHPIITGVFTGQDEINLPASVISCQLQLSHQMTINSVKIGALGSLEIIEEVQEFLQNARNKTCPAVLNLSNATQWKDDVLQSTIDSILPLCSVIVITHDIVNRLWTNEQQSMQNVADTLLAKGPKAIVVQDENGKRYVAVNDDDKGLKTVYFPLLAHCHALCTEDFSAAIAAFLARGSLPLSIAISYSDFYSATRKLLHSPFSRISPLTFVQEVWSSVDDIYKRTLALPFVNKMLHSTLDELIYNYYIIQDYYFFLDRGHMLNGLVSHCTNDDKVLEFLKMQLDKNAKYVKTIFAENNLSPCDENTIKKMPACMNYTKLMRELGECRGNLLWIQGLIALLPCTLVYAKVGDWMIASGIQPTVKRYANFIDTYYDQPKHDRLANFIELVNRVANDCSYGQRQKLKEIFRRVCEYEYAFWNDAYQYGMQYRNDMMEENLEREENEIVQVNDFEISD